MSHSTQPRSDETLQILLVEDNPGDARLTREAFKETDCETTLHVVTTGDDTLDFLTQQGAYESASLPDLVLLDLNLPGKDGCDVLEAIRDDPQLRPLPVIMLKSSGASEDIARCYNAQANAYLTKPADPAEFTALVEAVEQFRFKQVQLPPLQQ
ncbi:response regulator [Natrarchaeobius halalkaliphilus]|uniref:Response regulator n=1 Tax=Natrarchaeobius halalkaliphilus TaxID=1679091 RepID=A0A3N6LJU4_9EURY|nr:response regulator [Natrarchaeobius halalkaliphilus]RQG86194.1 response regulator [Natrarchaeobius halalkaliphilus]